MLDLNGVQRERGEKRPGYSLQLGFCESIYYSLCPAWGGKLFNLERKKWKGRHPSRKVATEHGRHHHLGGMVKPDFLSRRDLGKVGGEQLKIGPLSGATKSRDSELGKTNGGAGERA